MMNGQGGEIESFAKLDLIHDDLEMLILKLNTTQGIENSNKISGKMVK